MAEGEGIVIPVIEQQKAESSLPINEVSHSPLPNNLTKNDASEIISESTPEEINKSIEEHETRLYDAVTTLSGDPQTSYIPEIYAVVCMEIQDILVSIREELQKLKDGTELSQTLEHHIWKQADELLFAAVDVKEKGRAEVFHNGLYSQVTSTGRIAEIYDELFNLVDEISTHTDNPQALIHQSRKLVADYENIERSKNWIPKTLVLTPDGDDEFIKSLTQRGLLKGGEPTSHDLDALDFTDTINGVAVIPVDSRLSRKQQIEYFKSGYLLKEDAALPNNIIIHVKDKSELDFKYGMFLNKLSVNWVFLPPEQRPTIILYTDGFKIPLYQKHTFDSFLFASDEDELQNIVYLGNEMAMTKKMTTFDSAEVEPQQKETYDKSEDLREWEHITADTYQSLKLLLERFNYRNGLLANRYKDVTSLMNFLRNESEEDSLESQLTPHEPIKAILDCGTGEGRIGGALARLGFKVIGYDISPEMFERGKARFKEEGEGLRGEKDHAGHSYESLRKLQKEGIITTIIEDDELAEANYRTVEGNFANIHSVLNKYMVDWENKFQASRGKADVDPRTFFNNSNPEYALTNPHSMFDDIAFDVALFNWHTFCEVGGPEQQRIVLKQLMNVLNLGGELVIEIPDRLLNPYVTLLKEYHVAHPDDPFGTLQEPKSDNGELYPPRYFPGLHEMILMLKSVGFEIDFNLDESKNTDVKSYAIGPENPDTGEKEMHVREYFITARKSKR